MPTPSSEVYVKHGRRYEPVSEHLHRGWPAPGHFVVRSNGYTLVADHEAVITPEAGAWIVALDHYESAWVDALFESIGWSASRMVPGSLTSLRNAVTDGARDAVPELASRMIDVAIAAYPALLEEFVADAARGSARARHDLHMNDARLRYVKRGRRYHVRGEAFNGFPRLGLWRVPMMEAFSNEAVAQVCGPQAPLAPAALVPRRADLASGISAYAELIARCRASKDPRGMATLPSPVDCLHVMLAPLTGVPPRLISGSFPDAPAANRSR